MSLLPVEASTKVCITTSRIAVGSVSSHKNILVPALADILYGWPEVCVVLCIRVPELEGDH